MEVGTRRQAGKMQRARRHEGRALTPERHGIDLRVDGIGRGQLGEARQPAVQRIVLERQTRMRLQNVVPRFVGPCADGGKGERKQRPTASMLGSMIPVAGNRPASPAASANRQAGAGM